MMVLCPNHHDEATNGGLDEKQQRKHKEKPFNILHGYSKGQLTIKQEDTSINIGGYLFIAGQGPLIMIDQEPLFSLALSPFGSLLIDLKLYDEKKNLVAEIIENEWIAYAAPLPWDLEFSYQELIIRSASRKIALNINSKKDPVSIKGSLWGKDRLLEIDNKSITAGQARLIGHGRIIGFTLMLESGKTTGLSLAPQNNIILSDPRLSERTERNDPCPCGSGTKWKKCGFLETEIHKHYLKQKNL